MSINQSIRFHNLTVQHTVLKIILILLLSNGWALELPKTEDSFGVSAADERLNSLSKGLKMPPVAKHGQVPVLNQGGGYAIIHLDPISTKFVNYCKSIHYPVLDIGAGYGTISIEILKQSSCPIIAEDMGTENLLVLRNQVQSKDLNRLFLNSDRFPDRLNFPSNSLGAVAICQVVHFLTGDEIDQGLKKIYNWLIPGGKTFIVTCSPYITQLKNFVPTYEERWANGDPWPGKIENFPLVTSFAYRNLPDLFHVMDERPIRAALARAGFEIEEITFIDRRKTIPAVGLDGREHIGVIAVKPAL